MTFTPRSIRYLLCAGAVLVCAAGPAAAQDSDARRAEDAENLDVTMRLLPEGATRPDAVTSVIELPEAVRRAAESSESRGRPARIDSGDSEIPQRAVAARAGEVPRPAAAPTDSDGRGSALVGDAPREAAEASRAALEEGRESTRDLADDARRIRENVSRGPEDVSDRADRPDRTDRDVPGRGDPPGGDRPGGDRPGGDRGPGADRPGADLPGGGPSDARDRPGADGPDRGGGPDGGALPGRDSPERAGPADSPSGGP